MSDTIIIGGSFAGLSAALYVARARRSVVVVDTGLPRNRFASASHGFFGHDGSDPKVMLSVMRAQVAAYPAVRFIADAAVGGARLEGGFSVTLSGGGTVTGRTLLLAFGISDTLPRVPGLAERWGRSVIHCPYCHGYEFSGQRLGVLGLSPMSHHQALLVAEWGPTTFFLNGGQADDEATRALMQRGIEIEPDPVERVSGEGDHLIAVHLAGGRIRPLDALFIGPRNHLNSPIAEQLGCEIEEGPLGRIVKVDEVKMTTVAGVYAAGDITRSGHTITFACADGVMAGLAIHRSLAFGNE